MSSRDTPESIDAQLGRLRAGISDLASQIDSYKTKTAAALGAGVFLFLLSAGAAYDLYANNGEVWLTRGLTREALIWIAVGMACASILLLHFALARIRRRDLTLEVKLNQLEEEYAELLERKKFTGTLQKQNDLRFTPR